MMDLSPDSPACLAEEKYAPPCENSIEIATLLPLEVFLLSVNQQTNPYVRTWKGLSWPLAPATVRVEATRGSGVN